MRKILFIMMALVLPMVASADDETQRLVVWLKNGEKVHFDLAQLPETSFGGGVLTIKTNTTVVAYQLANVLRYTYENIKVVDEVAMLPNEHSVQVNAEGDAVTFRNLKDGTLVSLYDLSGQLLEQHTAEGLRPITVSIRNRHRGVYVVKCDSESIKLMRP